jgi:hypothetical protein
MGWKVFTLIVFLHLFRTFCIQFGKYTSTRRIASGSTCVVSEVIDKLTGALSAVNVMLSSSVRSSSAKCVFGAVFHMLTSANRMT